MCDVVSMIKRCEVWNIARVDGDWAGRKVLFVVYVAKVLRWFKVHYKLAMVGEPQGAMHVASQIWQVVFASQTLPVFCLALRKKAQYVVVWGHNFPRWPPLPINPLGCILSMCTSPQAHLACPLFWAKVSFSDALPSPGVKHTWGFHKVKLRKVELGSTLPASNSRKG
jgi:hypothetical protein